MIGSRLGAYEILAELGSGGMGKVYRAACVKDAGSLDAGTAVALKVIHAHLLETEGFFKRFLREAQIGQQVEHENVVRTYDCDATLLDGSSQHFLVMEYVEGQTLRDLLVELERVPEELCRHIGREVAKGLAAIHDAGVVHRDLKPENVLITPDHVVKVMDLGVARLQDEAVRLSQAGAFVGSLEYAAPEQFQAADQEPDGRADLHALGVVLYELATGQHPYRDEDASRLLRNILDAEPRRAGEVNPQLSPFIEEVVHNLLAKDRSERFPRAVDLASVLDEGEHGDWWQARAQALRLETKRPLRRIHIPRETALYGRDDDLAKLHALYDQAKTGDGRVLLIEGEAGIGKTRLVDEFVGRLRQAGEDVNFLFGSYPPGGAATAAGAFSTAYREHFGEEGLDEILQAYLPSTSTLVPAFAAVLRGETTPTGAEPLTKDSLQTVFVHSTRGLATERPTIVLIDDLHFAPEAGRALFTSLAMAAPGHRILLVGTMRHGVSESWSSGITRLDHADHRALSRLGPKDLTLLLMEAFRSERLAEELAFKIAHKSDGNPFFAFEIIRGLREGQFITQQPDGTWVTTQVIQDIQVPSSVVDMVSARLNDLTEEERELLDVGACCGFEFTPQVVGEVAGLGRIPALRLLGRIERDHRLIHSAGRRYVFDHHQVQETLYEGLHVELRESYHGAIGEALEESTGAREKEQEELDGSLCVDLCEHLLAGARGERALFYLVPALDYLAAGYVNDRALELAEQALAVPDLLAGKARLSVLTRKNNYLYLLGRWAEQAGVLEEARALAEAADDRSLVMGVKRSAGILFLSLGRFEEARAYMEQSLALAREIGDEDGEAAATINLGNVDMSLSQFAEGQSRYERGLRLAQACGNGRWETAATINLGNALFSQGHLDLAREAYEHGVSLAAAGGYRQFESTGILNQSRIYETLGRYGEAQGGCERGLALAVACGSREAEANARSALGGVHNLQGRTAAALEQVQRSLSLAREMGDPDGEASSMSQLGALWLTLGALQPAREALETSLASFREKGHPGGEAHALQALGRLAAESGDADRALELAEAALEIRRSTGQRTQIPGSLLQVGVLHGQAGRLAAAREALDEALALLLELQSRTQVALALSVRASLWGGDVQATEEACARTGEGVHTTAIHYNLWKATGERSYLERAKRLLDEHVEYAPEEFRVSMLENVRLHREITEAWAAQGES